MNRRWLLTLLGIALVWGVCAAADASMVTRQSWGAAPPILAMRPHQIQRMTIHHLGEMVEDSVDVPAWMRHFQAWCQKPAMLEDGRQRPAWADIPYHYIIFRDGTVAEGRDCHYAGDTNTTYDPAGHLLITVAGDLEKQPLTDAQYTSLVRLCTDACRRYNLSPDTIRGHKDYAETDCPGRNVYVRMASLRSDVAAALHPVSNPR